MKKTLLAIAMVCVASATQAQKPAIPRDAALEAKIEKTLSRMTLDEKIGQMLELNLDVMGKMTVENAKIDREKVRSVLQQYGRPDEEIENMVKLSDQEIGDTSRLNNHSCQPLVLNGREAFIHYLNPSQCYVWRALYQKSFSLKKDDLIIYLSVLAAGIIASIVFGSIGNSIYGAMLDYPQPAASVAAILL